MRGPQRLRADEPRLALQAVTTVVRRTFTPERSCASADGAKTPAEMRAEQVVVRARADAPYPLVPPTLFTFRAARCADGPVLDLTRGRPMREPALGADGSDFGGH